MLSLSAIYTYDNNIPQDVFKFDNFNKNMKEISLYNILILILSVLPSKLLKHLILISLALSYDNKKIDKEIKNKLNFLSYFNHLFFEKENKLLYSLKSGILKNDLSFFNNNYIVYIIAHSEENNINDTVILTFDKEKYNKKSVKKLINNKKEFKYQLNKLYNKNNITNVKYDYFLFN